MTMGRRPKYFYASTREEMLASANPSFQGGNIDYTRDKKIDPLDSLYMDAKRDTLINGEKLDETVIEDLAAFKEWLINIGIAEQNIQHLAAHYSQRPNIFAADDMQAYCTVLVDSPVLLTAPEATKKTVYQENNEVYLSVELQDYPVKTKDSRGDYAVVGKIKGPVEALFKLSATHGFELQHVSTNSMLFRDMFLGKPISNQRILMNCPEYLAKELEPLVRQLRENADRIRGLSLHSARKLTDHEQLELASSSSVLIALVKFKRNEIDFEDLRGTIIVYQQQIKLVPANGNSMFQKVTSFFAKTSNASTKEIIQKISERLQSVNSDAINELNNKKQSRI